jgi:hypothetical protein
MWQSKKMFAEAEQQVARGRKFSGKKTLLVLTDGEDTWFKDDVRLQAKTGTSTIPDLLRKEFARSRISINMVIFQSDDAIRDKAKEQFKETIVNDLTPRGSYYDGKIIDAKDLAQTLREAMGLRFIYRVRGGDGFVRPFNSRSHQDLHMLRPNNWTYYYFPEGDYELQTRLDYDLLTRPDPRTRQRVWLERGELLLLNFTSRGFEPALVSDLEEFKKRPQDSKKGWRMTVLQTVLHDTRHPDSSRTLFLALEKERSPRDKDLLQPFRPREVWLEVTRAGEKSPPDGVLWGRLPGSAASVWQMEVPRGVDLRRVSAWVSEGPYKGEHVFIDGSEPNNLTQPVTVNVHLGQQVVRMEVGEEPHTVVDRSGKVRAGVKCLVVRADYEAEDPVRAVLPSAPSRSGSEHHYYVRDKRGRYTGVFWSDRAQAGELVREASKLQVISLRQFKRSATLLAIPGGDLSRPSEEAAQLSNLNRLEDLQQYSPRDER